MQKHEDERDIQSPIWTPALIPRRRFAGYDEAPRPPWSRVAAEELEPRLRRSDRQEQLQDRGVVERF